MITVPPLERHCNSWVIAKHGKAVMETWSRAFVDRLAGNAQPGVEIFTAAQWLGALNQESMS